MATTVAPARPPGVIAQAVTPQPPDPIAARAGRGRDVAARIRALEAELRTLRRLAVDELVRAMVTTIAGRELAFNAIEVWNHARLLSPGLRRALEAAGMTSPCRLGKLLQQLQGRDVGGLRLERIGEDYHGAVWMFRECPAHSGAPLPNG